MIKEYTADSGAAVPEIDPASGLRGSYQRVWTAPNMLPEVDPDSYSPDAQPLPIAISEEFAHIPLRQLVASLTNPRTTFNQAKLQELADSIRTSGVHQPILVRPLPGDRVMDTDRHVQYEIVAGERRFRACQIAGLATIPAMVRPMEDGDVLEVQIIENLQRDDLSELEEAEGYDRLMRHSSLNAEQVGAKICKSRSYVYARLKLLDLCFECQTALREGKIDTSRALLIARIPDHKLQMKALEYASIVHNGDTVSVRALQVWLQQNVMLPLERAPFAITDIQLLESAGSCKDCPKRTGASPDIFADVSNADICTDPPCYNAKSEAHQLRNLARAEAKRMRLVSGSEAKAICYEKSSTLNGYSPLSQVRADADGQRLDSLLGKDFEGAVLIENPWTLELIEAVPTAEAEGVLLARGLVKAVEASGKAASKAGAVSYEDSVKKIKAATEGRIEAAYEELFDAAVVRCIVDTDDDDAPGLMAPEVLLGHFACELKYSAGRQALADMGLQDARADSLTSVQIYKIAALLMAENDATAAKAIAKLKGVHLDRLREDAKDKVKAEVAAEIAALKAQLKPPKPLVPTAPLAQPALAPVADAGAGKAPAKTPAKPAPLRKPRLSAQEAQSGIAEAMQGIEAGQVPCPDAPPAKSAPVPEDGPQVKKAEPIQGTLPVGVIGIGSRVKVLNNVSIRYTKWIGKTGTVTGKVGQAWDVTFRGRSGGIASFDSTELEWVA